MYPAGRCSASIETLDCLRLQINHTNKEPTIKSTIARTTSPTIKGTALDSGAGIEEIAEVDDRADAKTADAVDKIVIDLLWSVLVLLETTLVIVVVVAAAVVETNCGHCSGQSVAALVLQSFVDMPPTAPEHQYEQILTYSSHERLKGL